MSLSATCASPPPAGGEQRNCDRPSVRGSRSRSHTGPRSGAEPPRQAALSLRHECRKTCAARGPTECQLRPIGGLHQLAKPRIAVDLKESVESLQMDRRMLRLAVFAVDIGGNRMTGAL